MSVPGASLKPMERLTARGPALAGWLACFLLVTLAASPVSGKNRTRWMASRLLSGKGILDYEQAVTRFVTISDPLVLPTLKRMTEAADEAPRAAAAGVMWHYNEAETRKRLVELISDPSPHVQIEAAKSLCLMKYTANLQVIKETLKTTEPQVRARAFRALAAIGGDDAKAMVLSARPVSPDDRIWTAFALHQLGEKPEDQMALLQKQLLAIPRGAWLANNTDPQEEDLQRAAKLGAKGIQLRLDAASALSRIGTPQALGLLVEATGDLALSGHRLGPRRLLRRHGDKGAMAVASGLKSDKALVRLGSARVAGRLRSENQTVRETLGQALGKALGDKSLMVRLAAAKSIVTGQYRSQSGALVATLAHPDPRTRRAAIRALGQMKASQAVAPLIERLKLEDNASARRGIYSALTHIGSASAVGPLFKHLKLLHTESSQNARVASEIPLCVQALAAGGDTAASRALSLIPKTKGPSQKLMIEVLAHSGSRLGIPFFIDRLRENPPAPDGPEVRFFDSLDASLAPRLEAMIEEETAMWIRVILARTLFKMGKKEYARGILWGLRNDDGYLRRLAAALSLGVDPPQSIEPLIKLLADKPSTARFAARALLDSGSARAIEGLLEGLSDPAFRNRSKLPLKPFWEGTRSATHPFSKEVDNDRVWVLFAEDRLGHNMDLFITWSMDGKVWKEPAYTGLTSFSDPENSVPPPTFSLKVRGRDITIAHTRTFAQTANPQKPQFQTLQRVHRFKLKDFFADRDGDGLTDFEEKALFCDPAREDTDRDGLEDGKDKNPLAKPAEPGRDEDILKVLAFSYAHLIKKVLPPESRLLVVENTPGHGKAPELGTFPHLVLHLSQEQIRNLWKSTGGGYPRLRFGPTKIEPEGKKASQVLRIWKAVEDEESYKVLFKKVGENWMVVGFED